MSVVRRKAPSVALIVLALVLGVREGRAQESGTLLTQTVTLVRGASPSAAEFEVAGGKSANSQTKIILEIGAEGSATAPPADPSLPAGLRFRLTRTDGATPDCTVTPKVNCSEFSTSGGADNTTFVPKIIVVTKGMEDLNNPRGLYLLVIAHVAGTSATEKWKLEITELPVGLRVTASIEQGVFKNLSPKGPCGGSNPQPCPNVCPPGQACRPRYVYPWWKYAEVLVFPKWPPIPDPCLSCPGPWELPIPDGFERVFVAFTPFLKENAPLGPGRASDVKVSISGGEAVGELFDAGDGTYMQLVQHRAGESPRVRASVGDVTSTEVIASRAQGVPPIYRTLTFVLALLLLIAIIALIAASRRRGTIARG